MPVLHLIHNFKDIPKNNSTNIHQFSVHHHLFLISHWWRSLDLLPWDWQQVNVGMKFKRSVRKGKWVHLTEFKCAVIVGAALNIVEMLLWRDFHTQPSFRIHKKVKLILFCRYGWCQKSEASGQSCLSWQNSDHYSNNHWKPGVRKSNDVFGSRRPQ